MSGASPRASLPWGGLSSATPPLQTCLPHCHWAIKYKSRGRAALKRWKFANGVRMPALARTEKRNVLGRIFLSLLLRSGTRTACLESPEAPARECCCLLLFCHGLCVRHTHWYRDCGMSTWKGFGDQTAGLCPCLAVNSLMNQGLSVKRALWGTPVIVVNAVSPWDENGFVF